MQAAQHDTIKRRLEKGVALLELISRRRAESGDRFLGSAIERKIIDRELCELETKCKVWLIRAD
jgi:hypothetical protein